MLNTTLLGKITSDKKILKRLQFTAISAAVAGLLALVQLAYAATQEAGIVLSAMGTANAQGADQQTRTLARRSGVFVGDRITTGNESQLQVRMKDGAVIALGPNAEFAVKAYSQKASGDKKDEAVLSLVQGGLRTISGHIDKSTYKLETPTATLGIRGTIFDVYVAKDGTTTVVLREGGVDVTGSNVKRKLDVAGLAVIVKRGGVPSEPSTPPQDVLDYLRGIVPDLPDNVTWHSDGNGGAVFDLGGDIINIINSPPPGIQGDGEVPSACAPNDYYCSCRMDPYGCYN
ncbi:MAG TPA: FecR family protein [Pseudomonadales bacterium]|nr:FecR family protein [Pseudomonadales bacterium]